jgi:hypothetical protein
VAFAIYILKSNLKAKEEEIWKLNYISLLQYQIISSKESSLL